MEKIAEPSAQLTALFMVAFLLAELACRVATGKRYKLDLLFNAVQVVSAGFFILAFFHGSKEILSVFVINIAIIQFSKILRDIFHELLDYRDLWKKKQV